MQVFKEKLIPYEELGDFFKQLEQYRYADRVECWPCREGKLKVRWDILKFPENPFYGYIPNDK